MRGFPVRAPLFGIGNFALARDVYIRVFFPAHRIVFGKREQRSPVQGEPTHESQGSCGQLSSVRSFCPARSSRVLRTSLLTPRVDAAPFLPPNSDSSHIRTWLAMTSIRCRRSRRPRIQPGCSSTRAERMSCFVSPWNVASHLFSWFTER
jgi:hypothetical protein